MTRRIWIDTKLAQDAIASKEALDALALCCMVKLTFADSMVKEASVRRMMQLFHISYGRCVKAIETGVVRGYFVKDRSHLRANRVRSDKGNCIPLDVPTSEVKGECPISITAMCDLLREAVIYNHIAKQNDLRDTIKIARDPAPGELKQMRRARARLREKGVCVDQNSANEVLRLSHARVASILNVSRTKAKAIVKRLCDKGLVRRVLQYEETGWHIDEFSKGLQKSYSKYGNRGFLVLCSGMVCLQLANAYLLCGESLVRFMH